MGKHSNSVTQKGISATVTIEITPDAYHYFGASAIESANAQFEYDISEQPAADHVGCKERVASLAKDSLTHFFKEIHLLEIALAKKYFTSRTDAKKMSEQNLKLHACNDELVSEARMLTTQLELQKSLTEIRTRAAQKLESQLEKLKKRTAKNKQAARSKQQGTRK
jgi:hypothetical protein